MTGTPLCLTLFGFKGVGSSPAARRGLGEYPSPNALNLLCGLSYNNFIHPQDKWAVCARIKSLNSSTPQTKWKLVNDQGDSTT
ncbi:hypothetical protein CC2G_014405 [Coprinopsis cinerea AmutBmut pab1-1]|nr:hypothetical protein CC2G_014405 [Coprinopsis cinerea AmutBmut pab1-1]